MTPNPKRSGIVERSGEDDWREWSIDAGDSQVEGKPSRLFIRAEPGKMVELTLARVTSFAETARELEGDGAESRSLLLGDDDIAFLLDVLPRARGVRNGGFQ